MGPTAGLIDDAGAWLAWCFAPEHILLAVLLGIVAVTVIVVAGVGVVRASRALNRRLEEASPEATALRTGWWLCPTCRSYNRPSERCYRGCGTEADAPA